MADQVPTSRKVPPLAIIVAVMLAALAAVAFAGWRSAQHPPAAGSAPVMPRMSTVPDAQAPASGEKGAVGHDGTVNAPGARASTASPAGAAR